MWTTRSFMAAYLFFFVGLLRLPIVFINISQLGVANTTRKKLHYLADISPRKKSEKKFDAAAREIRWDFFASTCWSTKNVRSNFARWGSKRILPGFYVFGDEESLYFRWQKIVKWRLFRVSRVLVNTSNNITLLSYLGVILGMTRACITAKSVKVSSD